LGTKSIELHFAEPLQLQSAWLKEIRAALSPYWSARAVIENKRTDLGPEPQKHADAA
jgi:hypothetical protein